ncbi:DUF4405 domain-containing protein [Desulfotalea psychrophila]|uniref:DUF4405 domain-containing protein n=1 Tax=Desulfotalea psychrophila TaxID=84980 RepID=UPI000673D9F3|nr:DUF4405 domain-containing protein [Desulfotalea psychrophila]
MKRSLISPFIAVTYITVAITGILMMFHLRIQGIGALHQWGGVLFIIGGMIHLSLNWRVFTSYFKSNRSVLSVCAGVLALLLILLVAPHQEHRRGQQGGMIHKVFYERHHR